jgi:hypothetical protein
LLDRRWDLLDRRWNSIDRRWDFAQAAAEYERTPPGFG